MAGGCTAPRQCAEAFFDAAWAGATVQLATDLRQLQDKATSPAPPGPPSIPVTGMAVEVELAIEVWLGVSST
ncbi:hypothetical protein [Streptomyces sp. V4I8]|uniref:hypothetical protein n=1 Tax=Streptomyces sp. V4I8 TaxID=3156469 RepID=UPI003513B8C5